MMSACARVRLSASPRSASNWSTRFFAVEVTKEFPYTVDMILGKLTSKAQTTIPAAVRRALDLQPGDLIAYRIEAGQVVMTKAEDTGEDDTLSLFAEWSDEADRAYDAL